MKQGLLKITAVAAAAAIGLTGLTGCYKQGTTDADTTAVTVKGSDYYVDEAKFYIYLCQYQTEVDDEFYVAYMYGSYETFWSYGYDEECKENALAQLIQTKILVKEAAKRGITLDADEEAKVQTAVEEFKTNKTAVIEKTGASDELIEQYVRDNAIANKMYVELGKDIDTTLDADAMRRKSGEGISVYANSSYTVEADSTDEDAEDETVEISEEDQTKYREQVADEVLQKMQDGEDLSDIADEYSDNQYVTVYNFGTVSASSEDVPEEGEEIANYQEALWTLSTGDLEIVVGENSSGKAISYVVRCTDDDDAELRAEAEEEELASRRDTLFNETYVKLAKKYSYHVYESAIEDIAIEEPLYESIYMTSTDDTETEETEAEETEAEETDETDSED